MRLSIIGTGYVGLVSGACFADMGNQVTCIDIDKAKLAQLQQGKVPIHEPGLEQLVQSNMAASRLHFTTDLAACINDSDLLFIAVGTLPNARSGASDWTAVNSAAGCGGQINCACWHSRHGQSRHRRGIVKA